MENKHIRLRPFPHAVRKIDKFCITFRKLIPTIELQYFVNLKANFNLNKFENLPLRFERKSIISIQSFFNVMWWERPSNHFQSSKCFIYVKIWFSLHKSQGWLLPQKYEFRSVKMVCNVSCKCFISCNQYRCLALYFHHDSPWSNARVIVIKCWVENVLEKRTDCPRL